MSKVDSRGPNNPTHCHRNRRQILPPLRPESKSKSESDSGSTTTTSETRSNGGWYIIRDIIEEKIEQGRVWYLIDWDGTDQNGCRYDPTWEPAVNVTRTAIDDWKERKIKEACELTNANAPGLDNQLPPPQSTQETDPVQPINRRRRQRKRKGEGKLEQRYSDCALTGFAGNIEGRLQKRRRTDAPPGTSQPQTSLAESKDQSITSLSCCADRVDLEADKRTQQFGPKIDRAHIVVELQSASALFLRSEFQAVPTSDSTQASSQAIVPQRARVSGIDQRVIADSQETSGTSASETHNSRLHRTDLSESQYLCDASVLEELSENSPRVSPDTDIPSRQPDFEFADLLENFLDPNISINSAADSLTNHNQCLLHQGLADPGKEPVNGVGPIFPTQVQSSLSNIIPPTSPATTSYSSIIPASFQRQPDAETTLEKDTQYPYYTNRAPTPSISQAAQPVQTLYSRPASSQSQFDFFSLDGDKTLPETVPRQKENFADRQNVCQPTSELGDNPRIASTAAKDHELTVRRSQSVQGSARPDLGCVAVDILQQSRPSTPVITGHMDNTPAVESPLSAKERFRRFREGHFNKPSLAGSTSTAAPSPPPLEVSTGAISSVAYNPSPRMETHTDSEKASTVSAATPLVSPSLLHRSGAAQRQAESYFEARDPPLADTLPDVTPMVSYGSLQLEQPATLDPSTLTLSIENDADGSPSAPTDDDGLATGPPVSRSSNSSGEETRAGYQQRLLSHGPTEPGEYIITLPFQSSSRTQYNDIIRENEALMIEYNAAFRVLPHKTPRPDLVDRLDIMFSRLFDMCDFPPFLDTLPSMSPEQLTKHAIGTNAKFSFVAELLDNLQILNSDKRVLIFARPGKLLELLGGVVQSRGYHFLLSGQEVIGTADAKHPLTVALCSTSDEASSIPKNFDVVIAFDHTFRPELMSSTNECSPPIMLTLVNIASIQHLNMCIGEDLQPLERKVVLMLALAKAMRFIEDPDPSESLFSVAEKFSRRIQMRDDDDDGFYWEPQPLPAEILDDLCIASSQFETTQLSTQNLRTDQHSGSRKRSHIDEVDDENVSKRPKMTQTQLISPLSHISDDLRYLLGDSLAEVSKDATVTLPISKLRALSSKVYELESKLGASEARANEFRQLSDRAQTECNGYVSSINKIQTRYMDALRERGIFEAECKVAQEQASILGNSLDSCRTEIATLKVTRTELEKKLAEANDALLHSSNPELVKMAELEKALKIANKEVQRLEKNMVVMQSDTDYSKNLYNEASKRAAELSAENRSHEKKIQELQRLVEGNILEVNKVQSRNEVRILAQQIKEQRSLVREREAELNRIKEELRMVKNGRRETRQSSVPRSPRLSSLGIMSPRNGTRGPSAMAGGPSSSRGTSPQPPMAVFDGPVAPGNGVQSSALLNQGPVANRFAHLRDQRF
ncbi:hypothetical protein GGR50DRAFT_637433 [Xylaria sp. CBS 124048]|nr:hypothetical protein GGR50DRAFT_637433 [Xylaria sp. CBS 124048]